MDSSQSIIVPVKAETAPTLMGLPAELRQLIFKEFFENTEMAIHSHARDCKMFCGNYVKHRNNTALLLVNKQVHAEAIALYHEYATFNIHRAMCHGHAILPFVNHAEKIQKVILWGDVAYRVATDLNWYDRLTTNYQLLKMVKIKLEWGGQQHRMIPEFREFINTNHGFSWEMDLHKIGRHGLHWKLHINSAKRVRVARNTAFSEVKMMNYLEKFGLNVSNIEGPIQIYAWHPEY